MAAKTFLREATGLVRALSSLDVFIATVSIVSLGGGAGATMVLLGLYPPSDIAAVYTIGLIPTVAFVVVYSIMTSAFPRSGGEYVWVSRIAGANIGFAYSWMMEFSFLFFILAGQAWFITWVGLPSTLTGMGLILKAPYLVDWSRAITSSTNLGFLVALIFLLLGGAISILGTRNYARIQRISWAYAMFGIVVWFALLLTSTNASFVSSFDTVMSGIASYEGIVKAARDAGLLQPISIQGTLIASIPLSWAMYSGFWYSTYMAGETKRVSRSMPIGLAAGIVFLWAFFVVFFWLSQQVFGADFMYAMSALSAAASPAYTLPFGPSISFLVSLLTTNPIVMLIASSTLIVWWFIILPPLFLAGSRVIFAWSYDRVIPARFAEVNEKFNSPIIAVAVCVAANIFWAYINAYQGYYMTLLNYTLLWAVSWAIPGFVAAAFPYVKRELYNRTMSSLPSGFSRKIAGVPILTIAGLVQGIFMLYYGYAQLSPTLTYVYLSPAVVYSFGWLFGLLIVGLLYFLAVRSYRKSHGLDLNMIFREIPPE